MLREWVTEPDEYKWTLSDFDREVAQRELREDDLIRQQSLESLRDWIIKNPRIENCRLDSNFLLRFLRFKKFSVVQAQEAMERYLLLRETYGQAFRELDILQPRMMELLDRGVAFSSSHRDHLGRRLIIVQAGQFDPYKFNNEDACKLGGIIHESLIEEEQSQIHGFTYFVDGKNVGLPYLTLFTPKEAVRLVKNGERTVPMRHKEGHGINCHPSLKFAVDFGFSIISDKLKKRVYVHNSVEDMLQVVDRRQLPKEYGGETPMAEMIAAFKEELLAKRERVLMNDKMAVRLEFYSQKAKEGAVYALKHGMLCKSENDSFESSICGNFRKLEVD